MARITKAPHGAYSMGEQYANVIRKRFDGLIWKAFFGSSNRLHYVIEWAEVEK